MGYLYQRSGKTVTVCETFCATASVTSPTICGTSCLQSPKVCATSYFSGCGLLLTSTGNNVTGGGCDGVLWIEQATSNDWGIVVNKGSYEYGIDARMKSDAALAYAARFGGTIKFSVGATCACHTTMLHAGTCVQSPIICATTAVRAPAMCAVNFCATDWFRNTVSGEGLCNVTNDNHLYSAGPNFWHINSKSGCTSGSLVPLQ